MDKKDFRTTSRRFISILTRPSSFAVMGTGAGIGLLQVGRKMLLWDWAGPVQILLVVALVIYLLVRLNKQRGGSRSGVQTKTAGTSEWLNDVFKKDLYDLPLYVVVGPQDAGKTTVLNNSRLNPSTFMGPSDSRLWHFFHARQAIFIERNRDFATARQDGADNDEANSWGRFLDVLKKSRGRQPINGVIVVISYAMLIRASEAELGQYIHELRTDLDRLAAKLNVRFPVYVLLSKCDEIEGFTAFFDGLAKEEPEQLWGATLEAASLPGATSDDKRLDALKKLLDSAFEDLRGRLGPARLWRLQETFEAQPHRLHEPPIYNFPYHFDQAQVHFKKFITELFDPVKGKDLFLRGFFLVAKTDSKRYFIRDVFTEAILPDRNLVDSIKPNRKHTIIASVLLGVFVIWAGIALFIRHNDRRVLADRIEVATGVQSNGQGKVTSTEINPLYDLHAKIEQVEGFWHRLAVLGLNRRLRRHVLPEARYIRAQKLRDLVSFSYSEWGDRLRACAYGASEDCGDLDNRKTAYERMAGGFPDKDDVLRNLLIQEAFSQGVDREKARAMAGYFVKALEDGSIEAFRTDDTLTPDP